MNAADSLNQFATGKPRLVTAIMLAATAVIVTLAVLPTVWPERFPMLQPLKVDTDPENMLADDDPVRIFHNEMKDRLSLHEIIVVGVVNETHPQGVFNAVSLGRVYELTEFARTLRGEALGQDDPNAGVIPIDIIAPLAMLAIFLLMLFFFRSLGTLAIPFWRIERYPAAARWTWAQIHG